MVKASCLQDLSAFRSVRQLHGLMPERMSPPAVQCHRGKLQLSGLSLITLSALQLWGVHGTVGPKLRATHRLIDGLLVTPSFGAATTVSLYDNPGTKSLKFAVIC